MREHRHLLYHVISMVILWIQCVNEIHTLYMCVYLLTYSIRLLYILFCQVTDADAAPHNTSTLSIAGFGVFDVDTAHNADGYFNLNLIGQLDVETQDRCHTLTITATNFNGAVAAGCRDATTDASGACTGSTLSDTATVMICVEVS